MKFPPYWNRTEQINTLLYDIDVLKAAYALHPVPEQTATELRRQTILKSSLYSARIEGNPMTMEDIHSMDMEDQTRTHTREISNIYSAVEFIRKLNTPTMDIQTLRTIHEIVLNGLSSEAGHFRTEQSAIYNQAGMAVYLPPPPEKIATLMQEWCDYINVSTDQAPIKAGVAHIWFEKIHPFLDGNGRAGRILIHKILMNGNYTFNGILPLEEYFDMHRDSYYTALSHDQADVSAFVTFFLEAIVAQARTAVVTADHPPTIAFPTLLPRRREIVMLIADHSMVTFDFLSRRFRAVPTRTLHHDLQQLAKEGYIRKVGSTRGALYARGERE